MKPAIFNTDMVLAILEDRKTQTRRVIGKRFLIMDFEQKDINGDDGEYKYRIVDLKKNNTYDTVDLSMFFTNIGFAPYKKGDIIYVRETFGVVYSSNEYDDDPRIYYKASPDEYDMHHDVYKWKPSIHMPKEYARLFLRVKDVRIERLNEISEEDAIAEGVHTDGVYFSDYLDFPIDGSYPLSMFSAKDSFHTLWESIYGDGSFNDDYVWVIEFEKISKEEAISETAT